MGAGWLWWLGWALGRALTAAGELIEYNYGDECTKRSYTCAEFEACCTNRTRYSARTRYNCLEAMDGRLMIYQCVGAVRRRASVPASLQAACAAASEDYSAACIQQAFGCWDFKHCCRQKGGGRARTYCSEFHKDVIDDFLCCSVDTVSAAVACSGSWLLSWLLPLVPLLATLVPGRLRL